MKKLTLFFICIFFLLFLQAQDANYAGAAKLYVTNYYKQLAEAKTLLQKQIVVASKTKIDQLEKTISMIKTKDASYNVSLMETEIKKLKEALTTAEQNKASIKEISNAKTVDKLKLKKLLDEVFNIGAFTFPNLETAQAENDAYQAQVQELLDTKEALTTYLTEMKSSNEYDRFVGKMKTSFDRIFETFPDKVERIFEQSTGAGTNWKNAYYELQAEQIHWNAAQKVFPDEPKFAEAYQKITALVNKYGSLDKIAAQNAVNNIDKIKSTKLPTPVIKDANLEKMFVDTFNKKFKEEYKGTAIKAIMLQSDWQIERNQLTGIVTGRIRQGAVVYKGLDGKCYLISIMHLYQGYIGNTFQQAQATYAQDGQEMLCENAN